MPKPSGCPGETTHHGAPNDFEDVAPLLAEARAAYPSNCLLMYLEGQDLIGPGAYEEAMTGSTGFSALTRP